MAILEGAAGIGKTALLEMTHEMAAAAGFTVAVGGADELDQVTWLGPLLTALRRSDPPVLLPDGLAEPRGDHQQLWLLERLRDVLEAVAGRRPLLVSIDDLQWADEATLAALGSLPPQLFAVPVLWLLACRPFPATPRLETALGRLTGAGAIRLPVGQLDRSSIAQLAESIAGAEPDAAFRRLLDQAQGNPFYVIELVRTLLHDGRVEVADGRATVRGGGLTPRFRSAIRPHVRALSESGQRLLEIGSIFGRTFRVADVGAVLGVTAGSSSPAVIEATAAAVLVEEDDELSFRHDLLRHAIYDELPSPARRALHREVATALMASGALATRVAPHLARSADPGDEQAITVLTQAAADLAGRSPGDAADMACRALELLPESDPRRLPAFMAAVDLLSWAGRTEDARALAEPLLVHLGPSQKAPVHLSLLRAAVLGDGRRAELPSISDDRLYQPDVPAGLRAEYLLMSAAANRYVDIDRAAAFARRGVAEARATGIDTALLFSFILQIQLELGNGNIAAALENAEHAQALAERGRDELKGSVPRTELGQALHAADRLPDALQVLAQSQRDAEQYRAHLLSLGEANHAAVQLSLGRLDDAAAEAESAAGNAETSGFSLAWCRAMRIRVEVAVRRGDLPLARVHLAGLQPFVDGRRTWPGERWANGALAEAACGPGAALAALEEAYEDLHEGRYWIAMPEVERLPRLVSVAMRAGDRARARAVVDSAVDLAKRNPGLAALTGAAAHCRGLLDDDPAQLRLAIDAMTASGRSPAVGAAEEDLAAMVERDHDAAAAIQLLEAAFGRASASGAMRDLARIRRRLRDLGVRKRQASGRRPAIGWQSLTDSERAVVRVISEGATSKEAARRLFLSVNTVNTHLRHAFVKLGVQSRVALTRVALRHVDER